MLTNLAATHEDTRLVLQRGLTVSEDNANRLTVREKGDSALMESFDSKQMVRNLCASQYYHKMDFGHLLATPKSILEQVLLKIGWTMSNGNNQ